MKLYFTSSDIHSFYSEWMDALHNKGFDLTNHDHCVIICGDLLDRGLESNKCYEFVKTLAEQGRLVYVRGNHEDLLFEAVRCIDKRKHLGRHHLSNGTLQTIVDMMGTNIYDLLGYTFDWKKWDELINDTLLPFISTNCVDYFELGDTIFVHGWVPTAEVSDTDRTLAVHDNWREGNWTEARWENGMQMFNFGLAPKSKNIVCGHWHASYGHANITKSCTEFGPDAIFTPFVFYNEETDSTIMAIDACTAHTRFVNCVVFDEEGGLIENV